MARKRNPLSEQVTAVTDIVSRHPVATAAVAGIAAAGVGALLCSRRGRDDEPEGQRLRDRPTGEVSFVDDGVQGY